VAGLDLGVRPIGPWSDVTTLSSCGMPLTRTCLPGTVRAPCNSLARARYRMSLTRVDLPEPETPVNRGQAAERERDVDIAQVVLVAPFTVSWRVLSGLRRTFGTADLVAAGSGSRR